MQQAGLKIAGGRVLFLRIWVFYSNDPRRRLCSTVTQKLHSFIILVGRLSHLSVFRPKNKVKWSISAAELYPGIV